MKIPRRIKDNQVLLIGKIEFEPELRVYRAGSEKAIENTASAHYRVFSEPTSANTAFAAASWVDPYPSVPVESLFAINIPVERVFFHGFDIDLSTGAGLPDKNRNYSLYVPAFWKLNFPTRARAIYIGTITVQLDRYLVPVEIDIRDEYDAAADALREVHPDVQLYRADLIDFELP